MGRSVALQPVDILQLGLPQSFAPGQAFFQVLVESDHDVFRLFVGYAPKGGDDAFGAGVGEAAGQADDAFAPPQLPDARFAGRQHHRIGVEL